MPIMHNDNFKIGSNIYVIDYFCSHEGTKAIIANAIVKQIFEDTQTIVISISDRHKKKYHFKDYNRLVFDNYGKAELILYNLPEPKSIVYTITEKKVEKKEVKGIYDITNNDITDLVILLNDGKQISTSKIGKTIFLNESEANEYIKNTKGS